jgi:hypothetical protein
VVHIILTLDYEIFGNGAGDVMRDIIQPTNRILEICDRRGVKLTIMFEVGEYWAFKQYDRELRGELGYSPSAEMKNQAIDAIERGHDVQLHLHPQWIGAKFSDGLWYLNVDQWRIADLPNGLGNEGDVFSIIGALYKGKKTLEDMLRSVNPDYECRAFRAGGFYVQPASDVIRAMKAVGIVADTSVVKGLCIERPWKLDYRNAVSDHGYWWTSDDDVAGSGEIAKNIVELPVCSQLKPYIYNFRWTKLRTTLKRRDIESKDRYTKGFSGEMSTPQLTSIFRKLFVLHPMNCDFCKLTPRSMLTIVKDIVEVDSGQRNEIVPVIMIGHCKDFWNDKHLDTFLRNTKKRVKFEDVSFETLIYSVERIIQKDKYCTAI